MLNLIGEMPDNTGTSSSRRACTCTTMANRPRPGRKLGHLTFVERSAAARDRRARRLLGRVAADVRIPVRSDGAKDPP